MYGSDNPPKKKQLSSFKADRGIFHLISFSFESGFFFSCVKAVSGKVNRKHSLQAKIKKDDVSKETWSLAEHNDTNESDIKGAFKIADQIGS